MKRERSNCLHQRCLVEKKKKFYERAASFLLCVIRFDMKVECICYFFKKKGKKESMVCLTSIAIF